MLQTQGHHIVTSGRAVLVCLLVILQGTEGGTLSVGDLPLFPPQDLYHRQFWQEFCNLRTIYEYILCKVHRLTKC